MFPGDEVRTHKPSEKEDVGGLGIGMREEELGDAQMSRRDEGDGGYF